ncbi:MAG: Glycerol-3-phosphate dehydrogenase [Chloroflexi bacterium]|jgi:glycerol-3-phosphate dehydrogenase (NAD(P)+)|nr:Glycerol-3-phosphate dehydrogenase [Chloroflexota bacterium]
MTRQASVAVVGAGSWGTTVASMVARRTPTTIWARRPEVAEEIASEHTNEAYLPDRVLDPGLRATAALDEAVGEADVVVMAVPSHGFREVLEQAAPHLRPWIPVISLSKGLERGTRARMTQVISEVLPGHPAGVLAGPNLAREILDGYAAAALVAMPDLRVAAALQEIFRSTLFRVYTGTDVCGAEIAGALKNVFAIAAGMAAGLGTGDNTLALVISRCLAELTRLGVAMGGKRHTFAGLAGMGDLLATCMSPQSRNRRVGLELARGRSLEEVTGEMTMVAEGVRTSRVVMELAAEHGVEVPIAHEVHMVINEGRTPEEAFRGLMRRRPTTELAAG